MASVSLAYFLGPLLGGEISQYIGFSWLMSIIGLANISYAIYLVRSVLFSFQPEVRNFFLYSTLVKAYRNHFEQGYNDKDPTEANNKFFMGLWPSNATLSSNSSYKRFYDSIDKPQH